MCHPDKCPANIAIYLSGEIQARTQYKRELESLIIQPTFLVVERREYEHEKERLEGNIKRLYNEIEAIAKKYLPDIEYDNNPEITIANILAALPPPEELIVKKVYHSSE